MTRSPPGALPGFMNNAVSVPRSDPPYGRVTGRSIGLKRCFHSGER